MRRTVLRLLPVLAVSACVIAVTPAAMSAVSAAPAAHATAAGQGQTTWTLVGHSSTYGFYSYHSSSGLTTTVNGFAGYSFTGTLTQLQEKALHVSTLPE